MQIEQLPLPYNSSRYFLKPNEVIFHHSAGPTLAGALATLHQKKLSYHYIIDRDGVAYQLTPENRTAYHAGNWLVNLRSIGVCFVGMDDFTDAQYTAGHELYEKIGLRDWRKHGQVKATACPGGLDCNRIVALPTPPPPLPEPTSPVSNEFPKTVTVTVNKVYVRQQPDQNAPLGGSQSLLKGNTFTAINRVTGSDPYNDGRNTWLESSKHNYVWEAGVL